MIATIVDTAGPLLMMISSGFFKALQERFFAAAVRNEKLLIEDKLGFQRTIVSCSKFHQNALVYVYSTALYIKYIVILNNIYYDLCHSLSKKIELMTRMMFIVELMCEGYNISLIGLMLAGVRHT